MLEWLNDESRPSAMEQSQIPDAPETPAPLFAYRALKGILFGSPDCETEDEDKENIAPSSPVRKPKSPSRNPSKPLQGHPSSQEAVAPQAVSNRIRDAVPASPSPPKRPHLSPTKSILRTPGIPTPRRSKINVTFKDLRASISPVTNAQKRQPFPKLDVPAHKGTEMESLAQDNALAQPTKASVEVDAQLTPVYDMSSVDTYLKTTEREMKKLVRYGQKMKEYARRADQENAMLKKERDELKRTVEVLKMTKGGLESNGKGTDVHVNMVIPPQRLADMQGVSIGQRRTTTKDVGGLNEVGARKPGRTARSLSLRTNAAKVQPEAPKPSFTEAASAVQSPPVQSKKRLKTTTAQLAPDRLAAAKERLRIKSEERRRALSTTME